MFFVIVVGGGKVGSNLASLLLAEGQEVKIIDDRPEVVARLKLELPEHSVMEGDGSSPSVLEAADVRRAKVLAAVTAEDVNVPLVDERRGVRSGAAGRRPGDAGIRSFSGLQGDVARGSRLHRQQPALSSWLIWAAGRRALQDDIE